MSMWLSEPVTGTVRYSTLPDSRRRSFTILRCVAADVVPRCFRADEQVRLDLHARVAVDAAERDTMHGPGVQTGERRPASSTEAESPTDGRFVGDQLTVPTG